MNPNGDDSAHRTAPGSDPESPVAALADLEAWKARKTYPSTLLAGGPVFGIARERAEGGWEVQPYFSGLAPQDARDSLAGYLRGLAEQPEGSPDENPEGAPAAGPPAPAPADRPAAPRADYLAAADRLDRAEADEVTAGGERFRVIRAERFIRMGPDGPEPPRATDPDPAHGAGRGGDPVAAPDPAAGLVIDPVSPGGSEGVLDAELLAALRRNDTVPNDVYDDSRVAARTHPGTLLLPASFMTAEREGGRWRPHSTGTAATPHDARDGLAVHLRVLVPWQRDLTPGEHEVYKRAADLLDAEQPDELDVAGRHFRIVRVERLVRVGPDGPEGPRPSDLDPLPTDSRIPDQPLPPHDDEPAAEPDARTRRFLELFEEEARRRTSRDRESRP
ncbi:DUF5954 family protein [Streptomyces polygonati]|uniref:DUF5954 family protein n=1 Tax=Streptomyces polygonati TaxID=1617087 RepID=A0ABV8HMB1_9ACTN